MDKKRIMKAYERKLVVHGNAVHREYYVLGILLWTSYKPVGWK